jgi:predicted AAA+ superfamily ATPase
MKPEIERTILPKIQNVIGQQKVIILMGTRRVGKSYLMNQLKENFTGKLLELQGEDADVHTLLKNRSIANYKKIIGDNKLILIDEAQEIPNIGKVLKLMIDNVKGITIFATGSSSFDIMNKAGEQLTGRQFLYMLYAISQQELSAQENLLETKQNLNDRLIFGSYPEVIQLKTTAEKAAYLKQMVQAYLLKDILVLEGVRNSSKILQLLQLVAYQIGKEVSLNELGTQLDMSKNTVEKYLGLLTKVFILYKLPAYSNNLRKEISKSSKWLFFDNGVRNAIINDFRLLELRHDAGDLWENYIIGERIKLNNNKVLERNYFFWRTYDEQEIDLIEKENDTLEAFECKWNPAAKAKIPGAFKTNYPDAAFKVVHRDNYLDFITE